MKPTHPLNGYAPTYAVEDEAHPWKTTRERTIKIKMLPLVLDIYRDLIESLDDRAKEEQTSRQIIIHLPPEGGNTLSLNPHAPFDEDKDYTDNPEAVEVFIDWLEEAHKKGFYIVVISRRAPMHIII